MARSVVIEVGSGGVFTSDWDARGVGDHPVAVAHDWFRTLCYNLGVDFSHTLRYAECHVPGYVEVIDVKSGRELARIAMLEWRAADHTIVHTVVIYGREARRVSWALDSDYDDEMGIQPGQSDALDSIMSGDVGLVAEHINNTYPRFSAQGYLLRGDLLDEYAASQANT